MSSATKASASLSPELRLAQATSEFAAELSMDQRTRYQSFSVLDLSDVIRLTARFDQSLSRKGIHRSYGPRLVNFLESVRGAITMLTASSTAIASVHLTPQNTWGLVTISLEALATSAFQAVLEKVTGFLMNIGRLAPRLGESLHSLPVSTTLRTCLIEYHILVVQACHEIHKVSRKSSWQQIFNNFSQKSIQFTSDFESIGRAIQDEVSMVEYTRARQVYEKGPPFLPRLAIRNHRSAMHSMTLRDRLSNACSTFDHQTGWKRIRKQGSTNAFLTAIEYPEWRDSPYSTTLVYTGISGAGKSVMLANMVDDLHLSIPPQKTTNIISFFFCERNLVDSLVSTNIIGSLARQVLGSVDISVFASVQSLRDLADKSSLDKDLLCALIRSILIEGYKIWFVLDGLDHCSPETRADVLGRLGALQDAGVFKLCIALRQGHDVARMLPASQMKGIVYASMPRDNSAIGEFILAELERLVENGELRIVDPGVLQEVLDVLIHRSDGMFLWATSQLAALCNMQSDAEIRAALKDVPVTLSEVYARMLGDVVEELNRCRKLALELILVSKRPLTVMELAHALSIKPGILIYHKEDHVNNVMQVLTSCGGLVKVDEEDSTVAFIHSSVSQFLVSGDPAVLDYQQSCTSMITRALTCLQYEISSRDLVRSIRTPDIHRVPTMDLQNQRSSSLMLRAMPGFASHNRAGSVVDTVLQETAPGASFKEESYQPFISYAQAHWSDHLQNFEPGHEISVFLLRSLLENPPETSPMNGDVKMLLVRSVVWHHIGLFKLLLEYGSFSATDRAKALRVAEAGGREEILKDMINSKSFNISSKTLQLLFIANLIDSLGEQMHEQERLSKVIEELPLLLTRFALRLGHQETRHSGQNAMAFILLARSNIVNTFSETYLLRLQERSKHKAPDTTWQDRISLLGPRMGDEFLDIGAAHTSWTDDDHPELDMLIQSETMSQVSRTDTQFTVETKATEITSEFAAKPRSMLGRRPGTNSTPSLMSVRTLDRSEMSTPSTDAQTSTRTTRDTTSGDPQMTEFDVDSVLQSPPYAWLVTKIQKSFQLTAVKKSAFARLDLELSKYSLSSSPSGITSVPKQQPIILDLSWDMWSFLEGFHFGDAKDVVDILTNFLTLNSDGDNIQALSCRQYLQQTWGEGSGATLSFVVDLAIRDHGSIELPSCHIQGWKDSSRLVIKATGSIPEIGEIFEQILWLGSSIRCSPSKNVLSECFCAISEGVRQSITLPSKQKIKEAFLIRINYLIKDGTATFRDDGRCWEGLFQYPLVAMDFPIAFRPSSFPGLEMNLSAMMSLSHAEHIGKFDHNVVIKGHSTMFTLAYREENSCLWHFVKKPDGSYISYSEIDYVEDFSYLSPHEIKQDRHFVGWCRRSTYGAGTVSAIPDLSACASHWLTVLSGAFDGHYAIRRSFADPIIGDSFFTDRNLLRGVRSRRESVYIAGDRREPPQTRRASFLRDIHQLRSNYIVLWDVGNEKGWLTNATSALLHLVFASLDHDASIAPSNTTRFDKTRLKSASQHTNATAASMLSDVENLDLAIQLFEGEDQKTFQDRVADLYQLLSMMIAYQFVASQKRLSSSNQLEGWDFMDLADTSCGLLYPRFTPISSYTAEWTTLLSDISAVTLFARNLGEIFRPLDLATCSHWSQLPAKRAYLAASMQDLGQIMERHGNPLRQPRKLSIHTAWTILLDKFNGCSCEKSNEHSDIVQNLTIVSGHELAVPLEEDSYHAPSLGAVIFGAKHVVEVPAGQRKDSLQSLTRTNLTTSLPTQVPAQLLTRQIPFDTIRNEFAIPVRAASMSQSLEDDISASDLTLATSFFSAQSSIPTSLSSDDYLVAIVCALPKELRAVLLLLDDEHGQAKIDGKDPYTYSFGMIGKHNVVATCLPNGQYGTCEATAIGHQLLGSFSRVKFMILCGIGGGVPSPEDVRLGDVVVSSGNRGVVKYDFYKNIQGRRNIDLGGSFRAPRELTSLISHLRAKKIHEPLKDHLKALITAEQNYRYPGRQCDVLYAAEDRHVGQGSCTRCTGRVLQRPRRPSAQPLIHYGTIVSGDQLMKDAKVRDRIAKQHGALCFEMEAGGLAFLENCLVVRGICDYSDSHKHDIWQNYACATAAAYVKFLLINLKPLTA